MEEENTTYTSYNDFTKFLPEEVIYTIFAKLGPVDLCKVASVSSEWRRFCRDAQLWRAHVFENREFRTICEKRNLSPDSLVNWGDYYRDRVLINRRIQTGKPKTQTVLRGHSDTVFCTKFITETRLVTAGADASIRFWDINKTTPELVIQIPQVGILGLAYDEESKRLATGSFDGGIIVSNVNFDKREQLSSFSIRELKDVLKNKNIDFSDCFEKSDLIRKIEVTKAIPLVETVHNFQCNNSVIAGLHIQNNFLASGSRDACVRLWNLTTGTCAKILRQHRDAVNAVQMYDNCSKLFSSANDATILLWDVESGKPIKKFTGHQGWIWGLSYDPPSQTLVSCSVDGSIRIWDPRTGACEGTLANGREVAGISVDYNANRIVSGSFDSIVRIWDLRAHQFYASLLGHKDRCTRVDATENVISSASFDGTVILYNFK